MKHLYIVLAALALWMAPALVFAVDCDELGVDSGTLPSRVGNDWVFRKFILADSKTSTGASTACSAPAISPADDAAWEYYRFYLEVDDSCSAAIGTVRDYGEVTTDDCEGACDSYDLITLNSAGTTNAFINDPLGEQFDVNFTTVTTCTATVYMELWRRK